MNRSLSLVMSKPGIEPSLAQRLQRFVSPHDPAILPGGGGNSSEHHRLRHLGHCCIEMFVNRNLYSCPFDESSEPSNSSRSVAEECSDIVSPLNLARGFDVLLADWITPNPNAAGNSSPFFKSDVFEAVIGCMLKKTDCELFGDTKFIMTHVAAVLCSTKAQFSSSVDRLNDYLHSLDIERSTDSIICERMGDFYISYFQHEQTPLLGCVVGDCCNSAWEAKESVASRVLAKVEESRNTEPCKKPRLDLQFSEPQFSAHASSSVSSILGSVVNHLQKGVEQQAVMPTPQQQQQQLPRIKQTLHMLLQKNGMKEPLGKVLMTYPDNTDGTIGFYGVFSFPESLRSSPLINIGDIRGPTGSSKKAAEDAVCEIVLASIQ